MKRLLPALAVASVLGAAPAVADYRACMEFCTKERAFGHCNDVCSGQAANRPGPSPSARPGSPAPPVTRTQPPAAAPKAAESLPPIPEVLKGWDCSTLDGKSDAIWHYINETHDPASAVAYPAPDKEQPHPPGTDWKTASELAFRVGMTVPRKQRAYRGLITITDDCRVSEDFNYEVEIGD